MVLDRSNANAAFRSGFMTFRLPYPFWVKVTVEGFDPDNPAVSNLEALVLPWTSSLTVLDEKPATVAITPLARSTPLSWVRTGFLFPRSAAEIFKPRDGNRESYPRSGCFRHFHQLFCR